MKFYDAKEAFDEDLLKSFSPVDCKVMTAERSKQKKLKQVPIGHTALWAHSPRLQDLERFQKYFYWFLSDIRQDSQIGRISI